MRISDWSSDVCSSDLWIVGAFYFKEKGTESSESFTFQNVDLTPFGMPGATANFAPSARDFSDFRATSKAVFAQGNYHVTDALREIGRASGRESVCQYV